MTTDQSQICVWIKLTIMGCASSNPLVDSGKTFVENAKETAADVTNKGEHLVQGMTESAKDGFTTGIGHVKDAVGTTLETVGHDIESTISKVGNAITNKKDEVGEKIDDLEDAAEKTLHEAGDHVVEAVSEAKTVLASKAENAKQTVIEKVHEIKGAAKETATPLGENINDKLEIEDIEQTLDEIENDLEAEAALIRKPPSDVEPEKEDSPTLWEAAADAILEQRIESTQDPESDLEEMHPELEFDIQEHRDIEEMENTIEALHGENQQNSID